MRLLCSSSSSSSSQASAPSLLLVLQLVLAALLGATTTYAQSDNLCTVCYGGSELRYPDEPLCKAFSPRTNGMFRTDYDCQDLQLESYQEGCCTNPPLNHCDYCADGTEFNPDGIVPSGQFVGGQSCFDYKYSNSAHISMFNDGTCDDTLMRRSGQYCGCPDQVQECWLCPDQNPPNNPGKADEWVTGSNCRGIEFLFSLLSKDECSSFQMDVGADLAIFCGCNGLDQEEIEAQKQTFQCELCRNGGFMTDPKRVYTQEDDPSVTFSKTCQQADDFARDVIKTPYACNNQRYFENARSVCCSNGSGASGSIFTNNKRSLAALLVAGAMAMVFV